jgi:hypothetical protein
LPFFLAVIQVSKEISKESLFRLDVFGGKRNIQEQWLRSGSIVNCVVLVGRNEGSFGGIWIVIIQNFPRSVRIVLEQVALARHYPEMLGLIHVKVEWRNHDGRILLVERRMHVSDEICLGVCRGPKFEGRSTILVDNWVLLRTVGSR